MEEQDTIHYYDKIDDPFQYSRKRKTLDQYPPTKLLILANIAIVTSSLGDPREIESKLDTLVEVVTHSMNSNDFSYDSPRDHTIYRKPINEDRKIILPKILSSSLDYPEEQRGKKRTRHCKICDSPDCPGRWNRLKCLNPK